MKGIRTITDRPLGVRLAAALAGVAAATAGCGPGKVELGAASYASLALPRLCLPGSRPGAPGATDVAKTPVGMRFSVRTPSNYDSSLGHPLLVVYPPAGRDRHASEKFSGLTQQATARGFIVAYPDHRPLKLAVFGELGEVPGSVAQAWCVDRNRVYLAGHSDGGTASEALVFLDKSSVPVAGFAASAAGLRAQDLQAYTCPAPRRVLIFHSSEDRLFPPPAYGRQAAQWWADCNGCRDKPTSTPTGCVQFGGCAAGASTRYCEIRGGHTAWPDRNGELLDFLSGK
jgi:polyhydroxybutyrate depolymerase